LALGKEPVSGSVIYDFLIGSPEGT